MPNLPLQAAIPQGVPIGTGDPSLTVAKRSAWNGFINYLDKTGYKGSSLLDNRNTQLGQQLMEQYKKVNPSFDLTYNDVKNVQQSLQDYRTQLVNDYKTGKAKVEGVTSPDQIMSDLSEPDGWLGSKTSSHKFPVASLINQSMAGTDVKNFGTDFAAYEAARSKVAPKK